MNYIRILVIQVHTIVIEISHKRKDNLGNKDNSSIFQCPTNY